MRSVFAILILAFLAPLVLANKSEGDCRILMLSGGGSWGAYEAGVIANLTDNGIHWDYITGVSAGSINALFLSGLGYKAPITHAFNSTWSSLKTGDIYKFSLFDLDKGLVDITPLKLTMQKLVKLYNLNTMYVPVFIGATSMNRGIFQEFKLNGTVGSSIDYILASSSIPIIFPMYKVDNEYYVDGGLLHNIIIMSPILECINSGAINIHIDMIILRGLVSHLETQDLAEYGLFRYIERVMSILYQNMGDIEYQCPPDTKLTAHRYMAGDLPYSFLSFEYGAEMFQMGYTNSTYDVVQVC